MVIDYYLANGQNKYRTCKKFHITKSMLNGWLQKAEKIVKSRPGSLKTGRSGRRPQFPNVEEELYRIYVEFESQGQKVRFCLKIEFSKFDILKFGVFSLSDDLVSNFKIPLKCVGLFIFRELNRDGSKIREK
jgi:hypothetical protein